MGETLYRGPAILFQWGRLCFDTESPEGRFHISQGETLFRGRLYFVTPARKRPCAQTAAPKRRRLNEGAQMSCYAEVHSFGRFCSRAPIPLRQRCIYPPVSDFSPVSEKFSDSVKNVHNFPF